MVEIRDAYNEWVNAFWGEYGYCNNPSHNEIVGAVFDCKEEWDFDKIEECAKKIIACKIICWGVKYYPPLVVPCVLCLIEDVLCYSECLCTGFCYFVKGCIPGDTIQNVERQVVDTGAGEYRRCG
jgi:hypothetical protein